MIDFPSIFLNLVTLTRCAVALLIAYVDRRHRAHTVVRSFFWLLICPIVCSMKHDDNRAVLTSNAVRCLYVHCVYTFTLCH